MAVDTLAPHFQIELTRTGRMDAMTVHVEAMSDAASEAAREASARLLSKKIKSIVGISALIDVTEPGAVDRSQGKAVRVVDNRPKEA